MSAPSQGAGDNVDRQLTRERVAGAVTAAALRLRRGDRAGALTDCQAVLAVDPQNPDARELLGEVFAAQGLWDAAITEFRAVLDADPQRVSAERKLAEASLGKAGLKDAAFRPEQRTRDRKPGLASLLSFFFPGLGQLYNGDARKGLATILGAVSLASTLMWRLWIVPMRMTGAAGADERAPKAVAQYAKALANMGAGMKVFLAVVCVCWLCLHIWSILDAARSAQRVVTPPRAVGP